MGGDTPVMLRLAHGQAVILPVRTGVKCRVGVDTSPAATSVSMATCDMCYKPATPNILIWDIDNYKWNHGI